MKQTKRSSAGDLLQHLPGLPSSCGPQETGGVVHEGAEVQLTAANPEERDVQTSPRGFGFDVSLDWRRWGPGQ